jgi:hypothetical protein
MGQTVGGSRELNRSVSFWIDWSFLDWPNNRIKELIARRCDEMAGAGVNLSILFGAHFRWDFLPIMSRLHDLLAHIAEQHRLRGIRFFDHHSSVLTHRASTGAQREHIRCFNHHHLPFYPDPHFAAQMKYNGTYLNDWRMIDVDTGRPIFINTYQCEQYCMNNPDFRAGYHAYLRQLMKDVPLDGLMSDDGVYYPGWRACGCGHCREKFRAMFGRDLPPVSDSTFWFNRSNKAFIDWIDFRYASTSEFFGTVRQVVGSLPLMSCSSTSCSQVCNAHAISYEGFAPHADLSMLEICGVAIDADGDWTGRTLHRALMQLAITRTTGLKGCLGMHYGFDPDMFELGWAINRLLGADTWLSTLKGRLNPKGPEADAMPEDQQLLGGYFNWEKANEHLFRGDADAQACVFFSRHTRDHFGRSHLDFENVYRQACCELFKANITFDVVYDVKEIQRYKVVVLPAATCMSARQREVFTDFLNDGGAAIVIGPAGLRDEFGQPAEEFFLRQGLHIEVEQPALPAGYQPSEDPYKLPGIECRGQFQSKPVKASEWIDFSFGKGKVWWTPAMDITNNTPRLASLVADVMPEGTEMHGLKNWQVRRYRIRNSQVLVALNANVTPTFSKKFTLGMGNPPIIEKLTYSQFAQSVKITSPRPLCDAKLFSPQLTEPVSGQISPDGKTAAFIFPAIRTLLVVQLTFDDPAE